MSVVQIIDGMIDLIQKNIVAKTNVVSNALTGDILVNVEDSVHFVDDQEIVLIDYGYNDPNSPHYQKYEYSSIKTVHNTHWVTLTSPIVDPSGGWMVSNGAFIQKTIGHAPLYDDRIYYGDREVIPTEEMAITVEPLSMSNEWIYIHGGLSEEYRVSIMIYGKDINTEEGMKILNLYADAVYGLLNHSIHLDINNHTSPLLSNVAAGTTLIVVEDTSQNREFFVPSALLPTQHVYEIQDNVGIEIDLFLVSVSTPGDGRMYLTVNRNDPIYYGSQPLLRTYNTEDFAVFSRHNRYFYDSRVDNVEYGTVQKGSAFIRAARLNWFGKETAEFRFPQKSLRINYFPEVDPNESSSSSSSSP